MASSETSNWLFDYGIMEDIAPPGGEFSGPATGFGWPSQPINGSANARWVFIYCFGVWFPRKLKRKRYKDFMQRPGFDIKTKYPNSI